MDKRCFGIGMIILLVNLTSIIIANAQEQGIESAVSLQVKSRSVSLLSRLDKSSEIPLLNSTYHIAGRYRPEVINSEKKFRVLTESGSNFLVDPLHFILISRNENRVLVFGDNYEYCTFSRLLIKLYSGSGDLIKSFDTGLYWPFDVAMTDNGEFVVAGRQGYSENRYQMAMYSNDGERMWQALLPAEAPMRLVLSPNHMYSALMQYDKQDYSRNILLFDKDGNRVHTEELKKPLAEMEFISDEEIIVYSGHKWLLYKIDGQINVVQSGRLKGFPIGSHPVTGFPDRERFVIVSLGDEGEGYRVQVFNSADGREIGESILMGSPTGQPYRLARPLEDGNIEMLIDEETVVLSLK